MSNNRSASTYLKSLTLVNVRAFGDSQLIDLAGVDGRLAKWTILLGENGVGKTTLLECLGWMRPTLEGSGSSKVLGVGPAISSEENEVLESLRRSGKRSLALIAEISPRAVLDEKPVSTFRLGVTVNYDPKGLLDSSEPSWMSEKTYRKKHGAFEEPVIVTYSANRQMGTANLKKEELEDPIGSRLSGVTELYDIVQILVELDYAAAAKGKKGKEHKLLTDLKKALVRVLPGKHMIDDIDVQAGAFEGGEFKGSTVTVHTFSGAVPISALSLGYQTMLGWVMDLAWRLIRQYPDSADPLSEPATVLIDEIDLHLHPRWQMEVMDALSEIFPATQFVASAHSPMMVQSDPNANFAVLREDGQQVSIDNAPTKVRGWRIDQILNSDFFRLSDLRGPSAEGLYKRRKELLTKKKWTPAEEAELREVEDKILDLPTATDPDDIEAMQLIRETAKLLREENDHNDSNR